MAVTFNVKQTGSTSATLHVAKGDTITIEAASTVHNSQLAEANAHLQMLSQILGVNFVVDTTGGAS